MKNRTTNALLKENKKALQFLHRAYGFDFEKPYFIKRIIGTFTHNTVTKAIREKLAGEYTAAILVKPTKERCFDKLHYVTVGAHKFDPMDHKHGLAWKHDVDDFFNIGDFEETRKRKTAAVWIIAQNNEFITQYHAPKLDTNTRYNIAKNIRVCGDGRGHSWIDSITLLPRTGTTETITYEPFSRFYFNDRQNAGSDTNRYIDKSGFIIWQRVHDRKHRARVLKAERERAAVLAADWTKRENELKGKTEKAKEHLCELITETACYEAAQIVYKAANYLTQILRRFEYLAAHEFSSVSQKENYYEETENLINAILHIEEA